MSFWIGTGWKMNKTLTEAQTYAAAIGAGVANLDSRIQPFVLPPYTVLREVAETLADTPIMVGAQNMHWAESGPWTGEISPSMLADCGAQLVEIGHSERREFFNETNETVGWKTEAAVSHGFVPLICVGETLQERESGRAEEVLATQVADALEFLSDDQRDAPILLAYEPVWAIGVNGVPATPEYANQQQALIAKAGEAALGSKPPVLYGGSVNADNAASLFSQDNIDGLFIGRAAWTSEGYLDLLGLAGGVLHQADQQHKQPSVGGTR